MADPYVGEIRIFAGNFAPLNWAFCNGASLPISDYETLFALIGTTYGGDGVQTFNLPDLRGRLPIGFGNGQVLGQLEGSPTVTLTQAQMPQHTHPVIATSSPGGNSPVGAYFASDPSSPVYFPPDGTLMNSQMITTTGGSQPHDNMMPYLCLSFIIALYGVFPTQS